MKKNENWKEKKNLINFGLDLSKLNANHNRISSIYGLQFDTQKIIKNHSLNLGQNSFASSALEAMKKKLKEQPQKMYNNVLGLSALSVMQKSLAESSSRALNKSFGMSTLEVMKMKLNEQPQKMYGNVLGLSAFSTMQKVLAEQSLNVNQYSFNFNAFAKLCDSSFPKVHSLGIAINNNLASFSKVRFDEILRNYNLDEELNFDFSVENNTISLNDSKFTTGQINDTIEETLDEWSSEFFEQLEKYFDEQIKRISQIKDHGMRDIILSLIMSVIITYSAAIFATPLANIGNMLLGVQNSTGIRHIIKSQSTSAEIPKELIKNFGVVSTNNLIVRKGFSQRSQKLGELNLGDLVCINEKKKDWILVELIDNENNVKLEGWVFTRYIKKLK